MTNGLNHVDLMLVVDTTGSMGPFIADAKRRLVDCVARLGSQRAVDLRVGLVEYRDHPPQESSFVTRTHAMTSDVARMQKVINRLAADGGGDAPEAVYDGVWEACLNAEWRETSCRFAVLVGDAPPHGCAPAGTGAECACGLDVRAVTAAAESQRAIVHALPFGGNAQTQAAFAEIAIATGGICAAAGNGGDVVDRMVELLERELASLDFDASVLDAVSAIGELDTVRVAESVSESRAAVARSIARLGRRGFFSRFVAV